MSHKVKANELEPGTVIIYWSREVVNNRLPGTLLIDNLLSGAIVSIQFRESVTQLFMENGDIIVCRYSEHRLIATARDVAPVQHRGVPVRYKGISLE